MNRLLLTVALAALSLAACEEPQRPTQSLERAVQIGDLEQIGRHIRWGSDLSQPDERGDTPLHVAARAGQVATVRELASHGARLDARDAQGRTPLELALIHGKTQAAAALLAAGAALDPQAALWNLVQTGVSDRDSFDFLIRRGADPDQPDDRGQSPLHRAVSLGHLETVRRLLSRGAQVNRPDGAGRTPLDLALKLAGPRGRDAADIVQTLVQSGARRGRPQPPGE